MWINSLREGSGIITPLLKVRCAGTQYSLIICSAVSEQMYQREKSEYLLVMSYCSVIIERRNANPKGRARQMAQFQIVVVLYLGYVLHPIMSCLWSKQSN